MPEGTPSPTAIDVGTQAFATLIADIRGRRSTTGIVTITQDVVDAAVVSSLQMLTLDDVRFVRAAATTLMALSAEVVVEKDPYGGPQYARTQTDGRVVHDIQIHPERDR